MTGECCVAAVKISNLYQRREGTECECVGCTRGRQDTFLGRPVYQGGSRGGNWAWAPLPLQILAEITVPPVVPTPRALISLFPGTRTKRRKS